MPFVKQLGVGGGTVVAEEEAQTILHLYFPMKWNPIIEVIELPLKFS